MTTSLDETPEAATAQAAPLRPRRPWRRLFLTLALLVLAALVAGWFQRRTIAHEFVDQELSRRGVRASYRIEQLSPWHQRLTDVVIGDPRNPDLTADWVELGTTLSPWGAKVLALRAGRVRLNARLVDGRVSLGALDRLMPPSSGKPFGLPHVAIDVADAGLRLDTGHGVVVIGLVGRGMLDNGFAGDARISAPRLELGGCTLSGIGGTLAVRMRRASPHLSGPLSGAGLACSGARATAPRLALDVTLGPALDRWSGSAELAASAVEHADRRVSDLRGRLSFAGGSAATRGDIALRAGGFAAPEARGAGLEIAGSYAQRGERLDYRGTLVARRTALPASLRRQLAGYAGSAAGTPLAPLVARLARSAAAAGASFDATADLAAGLGRRGLSYDVSRLAAVSTSGARLRFDEGGGAHGTNGGLNDLDGVIALGGDGMPEARIRLTRKPGDARFHGVGDVRTYAAGRASLSLSQLVFALDAQGGEARAEALVSGPLGSGRVERLSLPLDLRWRDGQFRVNPACTNIRFASVAIAGTILAPGRLAACPVGGAMVAATPGGMRGGVRFVAPVLAGRVGSSPLRVAASDARIDFGSRQFAINGAAVRLGAESPSRLDIAMLSGRFANGIAGDFAGLGGQIGAVPLLVSGAAGTWRADADGLALAGRLQLSDAVAPARFHPLASNDAALRLSGNRITATAGLRAPTAEIGRVEIVHDLAEGRGTATIAVPGLRFAEGGLQPSDLTPLTFGVIADVSGTIEGEGRIDWTPAGVTSSGRFGARAIDLAAAFGPVRGLATELHFDDLLGMHTAPGQIATTVEINPGVPVRDGTLRFRLLDPQRVEVEGGRWPFAGGELVLEPTLLDFSERRERRMTFRVVGADAALFLKEMEFENLDATGTFDGTLPMIFDAQGGRIEGGALRARAGGSLAYVGEISQRDLGFWGNMAFQALKALDYRSLTIGMNGPLAGDMVTEIRFAGVSQGKGTKSNFLLRRLAKLPFVFNVRVSAPFHQLLDSVQSWYDPNRLIERNLPTLLQEQEQSGGKAGAPAPVQPRESENLR
ncbi:hypothetical protein FHS95_003869 [Sphingomonas naasensis]|uniref:Uncharacterized protein n=1 Tax=Sphingomonas naasensis TaxID=1344951 RepID=A0A4S1WK94_9SPHN|nr:YdbH domain-containing protein [Sphingomonas naasensis]NIJ22158.1 hypothetical protein [Sphingomonas naasensis]TGX42180.1 hypothetical protein E5A74_09950 [Sphingomonas naasensis]